MIPIAMRATLCGLGVLTLSLGALGAGYGKTEWGMTLKQVRAREPGGKVERWNKREKALPHSYVFSVRRSVADLPAEIQYFLPRDRLSQVWVRFLANKEGDWDRNRASASELMRKLETGLTAKYGRPRHRTSTIQEDTCDWGEWAKSSADRDIVTGGCKVYWAPCAELTSSPAAFAKCEWLEVELEDSAVIQHEPRPKWKLEESHVVTILYKGEPRASTKGL